MQWLLLFITLVVMAVLQRIARGFGGAPASAPAAYATIALGCVTLAALLAGTIAHRLRMPRIIGYLLAGFISGPAWLRLVHREDLQALGIVSSGALALIAFAVGNELTLDILRGERRKRLLRILPGVVAVPFAAVALVTLSISPWFPLTAHQPFRDAIVVALALGMMATVSSPTVTWAVITDLQAHGPLSRETLDVSVLQGVVAVVLLIVVLALASLVASHGAVMPHVSLLALEIVFGSIALGIVLGGVFVQYVRAIRGSLTLPLLIFAFVVAQAVRLLVGADPVLIALAAGCTVRNVAGGDAERVRDELARCAIPVYVVFFALAGSSLRLDALEEMWPWALLLAGLRVTGLWGGLRLVGWRDRRAGASEVRPVWVEYGWLGLVSQGGLAITLAAVLRRAFPQWNVSLEGLLVAMIGVHELAGPICFQWVLRRAGEITGEGAKEVASAEAEHVLAGRDLVSDGGLQ
ncbi:MAG TPA: cation:proton antiporter [Gemmatimonadales bacterium]|nr:cation:proton antiporter [Gemmatimonadales bacterium]